jgi:uncharacterized protein (DUF488 family)
MISDSTTSMIWTIGHSNRTLEAFLEMLTAFEIGVLADVRRFPGSRKHPHFNQESLEASLLDAGIAYEFLPELGGRRKPRADSANTAWRNESFRAYADSMETVEFHEGIARLLWFTGRRVAIMCSEAVWWRCHRSLIADYLKAQGVKVEHIMTASKSEPHPYTPAARLVDGRLTYTETDPQARLFEA